MRLTAEAAQRFSDHPALREGSQVLTWAQVATEVTARTKDLGAAGAGPGLLYGWEGAASMDGLLELFSVLETGAVLLPINPKLSAGERARLLETLPLAGLSVVSPGGIVRHRLAGDAPFPISSLPGAPVVDVASARALIWTSGTSGQPTGVLLGEAAIRAHISMVSERLGLSAGDAWAATLSPAHVGGLMLILRAAVLGSAIECGDGFDALAFETAAAEGRITHTSLVPTMLVRLLAHLNGREISTGLRAVLIGGAHAPPQLLVRAAAAGIPVCTTYGMTEMCSQVATAIPDEISMPGHSGRPLSGVDVRISPEGEILLRGSTMALRRGLRSDEGFRLESLSQGGWFHTGDVGTLDAHGYLRVSGRLGDRIISGGVNVDPISVEAALLSLPSVNEALVCGVPDEEWGERVAALVVEADPAGTPTPRPGLRDALRDRLAGATLPRLILSVPALPTNVNGKADRRAAAELLAQF